MELIAEAAQHTKAMQTAKAERDELRSMYDGARKEADSKGREMEVYKKKCQERTGEMESYKKKCEEQHVTVRVWERSWMFFFGGDRISASCGRPRQRTDKHVVMSLSIWGSFAASPVSFQEAASARAELNVSNLVNLVVNQLSRHIKQCRCPGQQLKAGESAWTWSNEVKTKM